MNTAIPEVTIINAILAALSSVPLDKRESSAKETARNAAGAIYDAFIDPASERNAGSEFYRDRALSWLTPLILSEPGLSIPDFTDRLHATSNISRAVKNDIGGLIPRMEAIRSFYVKSTSSGAGKLAFVMDATPAA